MGATAPFKKNEKTFKGKTWKKLIIIKNDGIAVDITDWTFYLTVKENMEDTDANAVISKTITDHSNPKGGKSVITLTSTDTDIDVGNYYYDITYKDDSNPANTGVLVYGNFTVKRPVTTRD